MDSEEENFYDQSGADGDWAEAAAEGNGPDYSAATGRQKPYKILTEEDIKHLQENDISTVAGVLSVPRGVASSLLCRNNWNPAAAYDEWFSAAQETAAKAAEQGSTSKQLCNICFEETRPRKMASAACGRHLFCAQCWKTYIATAIRDGAACLTLLCPEPRCGAAVTSDMVSRFASKAEIKKYYQHIRRSYVESGRKRKWCPAAGCDRAIEFDDVGGESEGESYYVVCDCSHEFCFRCAAERHRPVSCKAVADWAEKSKSEAENTKWILAYTKPCPKCRRPIQKNQGCNHMTCSHPCRFQFCWICGGPWRNHDDDDDLSCNKYRDEGERSLKMKARNDVKRYAHYYERWESNDKSGKVAMADLERARGRCVGVMKFVAEAWEQIVECRRVLKWSYVYGYYLAEEEGKTALFEYLQGEAEAALERLHHCVEKEIEDVGGEEFREFRVKLMNLTSVTSKYFGNLVVALENNLPEVGSSKTKKKRGRISVYETSRRRRYSSPSPKISRRHRYFASLERLGRHMYSPMRHRYYSSSPETPKGRRYSSPSLKTSRRHRYSSSSFSPERSRRHMYSPRRHRYSSSSSERSRRHMYSPMRHRYSSPSLKTLMRRHRYSSMRHRYSSSSSPSPERSRRHMYSPTRHRYSSPPETSKGRRYSSPSLKMLMRRHRYSSMRHRYSSSSPSPERSRSHMYSPMRHRYSSSPETSKRRRYSPPSLKTSRMHRYSPRRHRYSSSSSPERSRRHRSSSTTPEMPRRHRY